MTEKILDSIWKTIDSSEDEFHFKSNADMDVLTKDYSTALSKMMKNMKPENVKCKGIRLYFVDSESDALMSAGLFVKDFDPEEWDDK